MKAEISRLLMTIPFVLLSAVLMQSSSSQAEVSPVKRTKIDATGRFICNEDGTVADTKTGLMWAAQSSSNRMNRDDAGRYVRDYTAGGHVDWRLPTIAELFTIYDKEFGGHRLEDSPSQTSVYAPQEISLYAGIMWSSDADGPFVFNFFNGESHHFAYGSAWVLPVRNACQQHASDHAKPDSRSLEEYRNILGMVFVRLPPGDFVMGDKEESPMHRVRITRSFFMSRYEVTQKQWTELMDSNPSKHQGPNLPVHGVRWNEVLVFIKKLSQQEGGTYRLPTEAEWEYACRAGTTGDHAGDLSAMAWYEGREPHDVGRKKPNAWGLYDMHGNVFELVQDWYGPYSSDSVVDPKGPVTESHRVHRGGGWGSTAWYCRSANRDFAEDGNFGRGFRLVKEID
jgi:formylglycine-generating enzyme required for sulfatase activity